MNTIYFDAAFNDDERRKQLYNGQILVYSPRGVATALCELGRNMAEAAFAPLDPRTAQFKMPVEEYAAVLADLKPKFIHHPDALGSHGAHNIDSSCTGTTMMDYLRGSDLGHIPQEIIDRFNTKPRQLQSLATSRKISAVQ
ncbi:MAG: hypothetical protein SGI97_01010 [candidate division Zixibacteria bacterium]|nr:hypothetical protein [candidate division Zixibacteria bacterium]